MLYTASKPAFRKNAVFFPELDHFVNHVFGENQTPRAFLPAANITENENEYVVSLAVPGFSKEDFSIKIENDLLSISAKKETVKIENEKVIRKEFDFVQFERTFHLNEKIDSEKIAASYENGVLNVALAKRVEVKPEIRTIAIS